jgi:hypothetical protein
MVRVFFLKYHFGVDFVNRSTYFIFVPANDIMNFYLELIEGATSHALEPSSRSYQLSILS